MATLFQVDPESFIDTDERRPAFGRGAWTKRGIDFDYRYAFTARIRDRIGRRAHVSLDHWAAAAGVYAIQRRLVTLGFLAELPEERRGVYHAGVRDAVKEFQARNRDPDGGAQLIADGIVGRSDARALFTPIVKNAQRKYRIPGDLLLGQTNHESAMDPGAVGYYIYYGSEGAWDYRGVDRGFSQINSKAHPEITWMQAYTQTFALQYSAKRMRDTYDSYARRYSDRDPTTLWDAAVCAHNNPWAGGEWAREGIAPTDQAATYVNAVKAAIY